MKGLARVATVAMAASCSLPAGTKNRCVVQDDCLPGFVCLDELCRRPESVDAGSTDGGLATGHTETNAPLELLLPRAPRSDAGLTSSHRIFRAYPGLPYEIRAVVVGGAYPYSFSLTGAPADMTVEPRTGLIRWTSPRTTTTPTVSVVDSAGATVSASWTISVGVGGFLFVDPDGGSSSGAGTLAAPWASLADVHSQGDGGDIVYLRGGRYSLEGIARQGVGTEWERVTFDARRQPTTWLAFPDERPLLDFSAGSPDGGVLLRLAGGFPYLDGLETTGSRVIGVQVEAGEYAVFRRLSLHHHSGGPVGSSSSLLHVLEWDPPLIGLTVQDSTFSEVVGGTGLVLSGHQQALVEDCRFTRLPVGLGVKDRLPRFTVRNNAFLETTQVALAGPASHSSTSGELLFNLVKPSSGAALDINEGGTVGALHVYRNTLLGRVALRDVTGTTGPFIFNNNVVVNDDLSTSPQHFSFTRVTEPARAIVRDNLVSPVGGGLVNEAGELVDGGASLGLFGHQRAPAER